MRSSRNITKIKESVRFYFRKTDTFMVATVVALSLFSVINIYGIFYPEHPYIYKQILYMVIGFSLMILFSSFNYRYLKNYSLPVMVIYIFTIFLLFLTFYSRTIRGVNSWIVLGNYTFEPSEITKLILIIVMAKYFSQRHKHINQFRHIVISGIYFMIPLAIVIGQPDLGSSVIIMFIWLGMLLGAGINKKHLFFVVILGLLFVLLGWLFILKPYQKERVISFLNPYNDPRGSDYNLIQSRVAIGSGYIFGKGFGQGTQANLGFLPEPHNDFVFAAAVEQFGLSGAIAIVGAVFFLISRVLKIGLMSESNFGKLFSLGLSIFIFSHVFIATGVNIGLMPVTGLPFPFLSYGGSNYISIMIGLGILESIKRYG